MDKFANIGKAVLIQTLGLQKNYIEIAQETTPVIDYNNAACAECKYKAMLDSFTPDSDTFNNAAKACQTCPKKAITQKTVYKKIYHNEKNRYGYRPRLKSNAIKLFMLLHFYHPDRFGIIKEINIDILAKQLDCDVKTVKNNLETLKKYTYISYCRISAHHITLCLCDYENYYLPASQGGRGFFVLSKELLAQLLDLENLLSLRIHLRELIEIDNLNAKGPFTAVSKSYQDIKRILPDYCKPCNIREAIKNQEHIFNISFKENSVRFEIREQFNARKQKKDCYYQYILLFKNFMKEFNETAAYVNSNNVHTEKFSEFFIKPDVFKQKKDFSYRLIQIRDYEFEDLAQLALQYSYEIVLSAFSQIYKTYIMQERRIVNLGGLLRTAIVSLLTHSNQAA